MRPLQETYAKRTRLLFHSLIISGSLNFALIATLITFVLREPRGSISSKTANSQHLAAVSLSNESLLSKYLRMPFDALIKELHNETHVEHGYRCCDLALACLTTLHHFDLDRALPGSPLEKCQYTYINEECKERIPLTLHPGLNAEKFWAIRTFANTEKWPLTPLGLYRKLCSGKKCPISLKKALMMTSEVHLIKRKFYQANANITDDELLDLLKFSQWQHITDFTTLPNFLMPCVQKGSSLAAHLLIFLERDYAFKYLDNEQIEALISLLTPQTPEVTSFLNDLSESIRPENIRKLAKGSPEHTPHYYVVQRGDSLWKISRMFDITIEELRVLNHLESNLLHSGVKLLLPEQAKRVELLTTK